MEIPNFEGGDEATCEKGLDEVWAQAAKRGVCEEVPRHRASRVPLSALTQVTPRVISPGDTYMTHLGISSLSEPVKMWLKFC